MRTQYNILACVAIGLLATLAGGAEVAAQAPTAEQEIAEHRLAFALDTTVTTRHSVTIDGRRVPYRATAGMQPVWGPDGDPVASVFYVYYERSDVRDRSRRPLVFSFNGGPGSSSASSCAPG